MIHMMDDVAYLIDEATEEEQEALADVLELDLDEVEEGEIGEALSRQLKWKFQTPLGYLLTDPSFDEMCLDVAKHLKLKDLINKRQTCWGLLEKLVEHVMQAAWEEMPLGEKKKFLKNVLGKDYNKFAGASAADIGKLTGGAMLLALKEFGGFAVYKFSVIAANQVAKALLGRGLGLAANAGLTRGIAVFLGPVGWVLTIWAVNDLMGTNYKNVIPALFVIFTIYSRLKEEDALPF